MPPMSYGVYNILAECCACVVFTVRGARKQELKNDSEGKFDALRVWIASTSTKISQIEW